MEGERNFRSTCAWFITSTSDGVWRLWPDLQKNDKGYVVLSGYHGTYGGQGDLLSVTFKGEATTTPAFEEYARELGNAVNSRGQPKYNLEKVILPVLKEIIFPHHEVAHAMRRAIFEGLPAARSSQEDLHPY